MIHCRELNEVRFHIGALEVDEGSLVFHLVTIVGCGEDGDHSSIGLNLVPFVLHLM